MKRALNNMRQIARLAEEAAQDLSGEARQAAYEIKLAAEGVLYGAGDRPAAGRTSARAEHYHD